jgi:hypothetical protein
MSIAFVFFCFIESVAMPIAVVLSQRIMVAGCGYPMSSRMVRRAAACCPAAKRAAYSASPALATTQGMIVEKQ